MFPTHPRRFAAPLALLTVALLATAAQARRPPCPLGFDCDRWNRLDCNGVGECIDRLADEAANKVRGEMDKLRKSLESERDKARGEADKARSQLEQVKKDADNRVAEARRQGEQAVKGGLKNAWGASQEAAALALCFKNNKPAWLSKIDPVAFAKDPNLVFVAVLQQMDRAQRAAMQDARKALGGVGKVAFSADENGARFELKLGLPRFDASQHLKELLTTLQRTAQREGDKAIQNCLIPHLQKNLARLQGAAQSAADNAQKVFTDNIEPLLPIIAAKGIELGLDKMSTFLGDKDVVTMMRAIIAEALLDPRHIEEMAAKLNEVNTAIKSKSSAVGAKAEAARKVITAQWEPTTETLYLLAVPAVAAGAKWAANKAVATTMPIAYDGTVKVLNLGMKGAYLVVEEVCALGDVFVEWACSAATKVVGIVLEGAEVGGRVAVEKLAVPITNAMVNAIIDEVASQAAARGKTRVAHAFDPKIKQILSQLPPDKRQKLNNLIKNTMEQIAGPAVRNMLAAMKHYNASVATLVTTQGGAGAAGADRQVSSKAGQGKPQQTKPAGRK